MRVPIRIRPWRALNHHQRAMRVTGMGMAALLVAVSLAAWRIRMANIREMAYDLHVWPAPTAADRLLIFAPHCDDETLGLSVLMQKAVRAGARVHVVFVTNGDGFTYGAEREFRRVRVGQAGFVRFGLARQKEALAALAASGVKPRDVTFLGYPDRGVSELWLHNWTHGNPYTSRYTGYSRSPYPNSFTRGTIYCGQNLRRDIDKIMAQFRPTQVFCPHSSDNHPDHWGTYAFVTDALWAHRLSPSPVQGLYLVHRGDWPVPQGFHPGAGLPPPAGIARLDTEWRQVPAESVERTAKQNALSCYVSQMRVMKRFLLSFIRRNELVGIRRPGPLAQVPDGAIRVDGRVDDWKRIPVAVEDPAEDSLSSDFAASGDILSIQAAEDSKRLYLRIVTRAPITEPVEYDVYWHALPDTPAGTCGVSLRKGVIPVSTVRAVARGDSWEISVPRPPGPAVFVGVNCRYHRFLLDRSGWRILESR